ncbi:MAG: glycerate kinase [Verrucomicrobia bacterium]|nr:glycerate kinase [Verrucomicrobiota bacterium]
MRVLIATDKFKGCMSAAVAANAIANALRRTLPGVVCDICPIADGGEGTVEAVVAARNGGWREVETRDARSRHVRSRYGLLRDGGTLEAVMEMSAASGLAMVSDLPSDPATASTYGTGMMLRDAIGLQVARIIIGIGGSATNDAGIGMAAALGYRFLDAGGSSLEPVIRNMNRLAKIESPETGEFPAILVACDVANPLLGVDGCTRVFGPQKGVNDFGFYESRLQHLADIIERDFGVDHRQVPGAGAAGGLGFGLMAFCGAKLTGGFDLIAAIMGLRDRVAAADLVITGEGRLDIQTLHGKGPIGVARMARALNKPVAAFAGIIEDPDPLNYHFDLLHAIKPDTMPLAEAMRHGPQLLEAAVADRSSAIAALLKS